MSTVDYGKIQTAHPELKKTLQDACQAAKKFRSFIIIGESGTGRRSLAQLIHENSTNASAMMKIYHPGEIVSLEEQVVIVPDVQFLNYREQEILCEQMQASSAETVWIATAQADFESLTRRGLVRKDLASQFQRQFRMPNLEERSMDRNELINQTLMTLSWVTGKVMRASLETQSFLQRDHFKGNIQELEEMLERAALTAKGSVIEVSDLGLENGIHQSALQIMTLAEMEKKLIMQTLQITHNNKSQAARLLGISIRTLRNKLSLYREASGTEEISGEIFQEAVYE